MKKKLIALSLIVLTFTLCFFTMNLKKTSADEDLLVAPRSSITFDIEIRFDSSDIVEDVFIDVADISYAFFDFTLYSYSSDLYFPLVCSTEVSPSYYTNYIFDEMFYGNLETYVSSYGQNDEVSMQSIHFKFTIDELFYYRLLSLQYNSFHELDDYSYLDDLYIYFEFDFDCASLVLCSDVSTSLCYEFSLNNNLLYCDNNLVFEYDSFNNSCDFVSHYTFENNYYQLDYDYAYSECLYFKDLGQEEGYENGYSQGYTKGENDGFVDGYEEGYTEGYTKGENDFYDAGFSDGLQRGEWLVLEGLHSNGDYSKKYYEIYNAGVSAGDNRGYAEGYENGYSKGKIDGESLGYDIGYDKGYEVGYYAAPKDSFDEGYEKGFDDGAVEGQHMGYDLGYSAGHSDGYGEGFAENNFTLTNLLWTIGGLPFESFKHIWNVDFLGVNIGNFFTGLFMALFAIFILKRVMF